MYVSSLGFTRDTGLTGEGAMVERGDEAGGEESEGYDGTSCAYSGLEAGGLKVKYGVSF